MDNSFVETFIRKTTKIKFLESEVSLKPKKTYLKDLEFKLEGLYKWVMGLTEEQLIFLSNELNG